MKLDICHILNTLISKRNKTFLYQGKPLELKKVFDMSGGMPILMRKVNLLSDFLFGRSLQCSYVDDAGALTGERLVIAEDENIFIVIMMLYDIVEEMFVMAGTADQVNLD